MSDVSDDVRYPLAVAFELLEVGTRMRAERHRREHPEATADEVQAAVRSWLSDRSAAPYGDALGRPIVFPRTR